MFVQRDQENCSLEAEDYDVYSNENRLTARKYCCADSVSASVLEYFRFFTLNYDATRTRLVTWLGKRQSDRGVWRSSTCDIRCALVFVSTRLDFYSSIIIIL